MDADRLPTEAALDDPTTSRPPGSERSGVTDAVRIQILATEHWSLLATRSMTWNEVFSRASMFITVLSAAVVALALVAQATGFGPSFRLFALLVLPVVLLMGFVTVARLGQANTDDFGLVAGMNRLRRAYLELAPELEPYFTTGHYDDEAGIMLSYGLGHRLTISGVLGSTPTIVSAINVVVAGVIAALIADSLGMQGTAAVAVGVAAALVTTAGQAAAAFRAIRRGRGEHRPRFPQP